MSSRSTGWRRASSFPLPACLRPTAPRTTDRQEGGRRHRGSLPRCCTGRGGGGNRCWAEAWTGWWRVCTAAGQLRPWAGCNPGRCCSHWRQWGWQASLVQVGYGLLINSDPPSTSTALSPHPHTRYARASVCSLARQCNTPARRGQNPTIVGAARWLLKRITPTQPIRDARSVSNDTNAPRLAHPRTHFLPRWGAAMRVMTTHVHHNGLGYVCAAHEVRFAFRQPTRAGAAGQIIRALNSLGRRWC